jgi:hypothetical protein
MSQSGKQLRPWVGLVATAAISAASAAYSAKSRRRATGAMADRAANAADRLSSAGSRLWRRLQTISGEAGKLYPEVRRRIA